MVEVSRDRLLGFLLGMAVMVLMQFMHNLVENDSHYGQPDLRVST